MCADTLRNRGRCLVHRLQDIVPSVRRGMIRYMFLIVDFSRAVMEPGFSEPRAKEILLNAIVRPRAPSGTVLVTSARTRV